MSRSTSVLFLLTVSICFLVLSGQSLQAESPYFFKKVDVCVIGVNQYWSAGIPPLTQAEQEAEAIADTFEKKFGYTVSAKLLGKAATKKAILDQLVKYQNTMTEDDCLIIYFSGHGQSFLTKGSDGIPSRAEYLLPYDADLNLRDTANRTEWDKQALEMKELVSKIEGVKARHVVLIADACCSGYLTKKGVGETANALSSLIAERSMCVLASAAQEESAIEGRYTPKLRELLNRVSKDREAWTVYDLHVQIERAIRTSTAGSKEVMRPQMAKLGTGDGEFVFFPKSIPEPDILALTRATQEYVKNKTPISDTDLKAIQATLDRLTKLIGERTELSAVAQALSAPDYRYSDRAADAASEWKGRRLLFERNVGLRDPLAIAALHLCAARGLGTTGMKPEPELAYRLALDADGIESKSAAGVGRYLLARCYQFGIGVTANERAAEKLYAESADKGFLLGKLSQIERLIGKGLVTAAEEKSILETLSAGMKANIPQFFALLGDLYYSGQFAETPRNVKKAVALYKNALDLGYLQVAFRLSELHSVQSDDVDKDFKYAATCLLKAASLGSPTAQLALAKEYFQFEEFTGKLELNAEPKEAIRLAKLAGEQGLRDGYKILAIAYVKSIGVEYDLGKAKEFYTLSTDSERILDIKWRTRFLKLAVQAETDRRK